MKPKLGDLIAASWVSACAGAGAFHVCLALGVAVVDSWANPGQVAATFAGFLLISLFGLPVSILSFLFVGSILGPLTYLTMARLGWVKPIHGVIAGAVVGAIVGLILWPLTPSGSGASLVPLFAAPTAFAGWVFARTLRRMGAKPPPARPSAGPRP